MRLIDADDLIITILAHDLCDTEQIDKDILEAPTVEAIPIEWLERYMNNFENNQIVYAKPLCKAIITNWREENANTD